jgi:hypothetical protein
MVRYLPARHYFPWGFVVLVMAGFWAWLGLGWAPAFIPVVFLVCIAALLICLALHPAIQVQEACLVIGDRVVPWADIRRVDSTAWLSPLVLRLTLYDDTRILLVYPGDRASSKNLLRQIRRMSRDALIEGVAYRQYWGEFLAPPAESRQPPGPRYRLLRAEDEAEIERMFQRLKSVGYLDQKSATDDK